MLPSSPSLSGCFQDVLGHHAERGLSQFKPERILADSRQESSGRVCGRATCWTVCALLLRPALWGHPRRPGDGKARASSSPCALAIQRCSQSVPASKECTVSKDGTSGIERGPLLQACQLSSLGGTIGGSGL